MGKTVLLSHHQWPNFGMFTLYSKFEYSNASLLNLVISTTDIELGLLPLFFMEYLLWSFFARIHPTKQAKTR